MTSSLVGSEMCIRDRQLQRQLKLPVLRHQDLVQFPCAGSPTSNLRSRVCLLYTSDAADDM
eukprot:3752574-Prorocentrum_lima.AAC.1